MTPKMRILRAAQWIYASRIQSAQQTRQPLPAGEKWPGPIVMNGQQSRDLKRQPVLLGRGDSRLAIFTSRGGILRFKICCITDFAAASLAVANGASALGFVTEAVGPPAILSDEAIREVIARVPPWVATVVLTASRDVDEIIALQRRTNASAIQLVDRVNAGGHDALRRELPGITIIQVVHVVGHESMAQAKEARAHALLPTQVTRRFRRSSSEALVALMTGR